MRWKYCLLLLLWGGNFFSIYAQSAALEYHVLVNANLYFPQNDFNQGTYPVLWYDKESDPKILLGGIGIGFSAQKYFDKKLHWKAQANLSKHTYWDEPVIITSESGNLMAPFVSGSSDFVLGIIGTAHYHFFNKISVGTGLGGQLLLASYARQFDHPSDERNIAANKYYKRFMPVLPLELSIKLEKHLLNIRYEQGLLNRYKTPLSEFKDGKYSLLYFEFGFNI